MFMMIENIQKLLELLHLKDNSYEEFLKKADKEHIQLLEEGLNFSQEYDYSIDIVKDELGLEEELINSLVEDYVEQILTTIPQLQKMISDIEKKKEHNQEVDFNDFRDLVHKNLGVARNLRIKDVEEVLSAIKTSEDTLFIQKALKYLATCMILLRPKVAYKVYAKRS